MTWYLLSVYVHVVTTVLLVGYALFWVVMAFTLQRDEGKERSRSLLGVVRDSRWPPVAVPAAIRLRLPWLGWAFLAVLAASGVAAPELRGTSLSQALSMPGGFGAALQVKLVLVGALALVQLGLTFRPVPWLAYVNGLVTLAVLVASALLRH